MKVGVLTFHNAYNYGAILQAYATQEIAKTYGCEVTLVDYQNDSINKFYANKKFRFKTLPKKKFYKIPSYIIEKFFYWKRRRAFKKFINKRINLSCSRFFSGDKLFLYNYDIILIGSDQLWNKKLTGGFDNVYWGEFDTSGHTKKIAWSICMNEINNTQEDYEYIKQHIKNFFAISVREYSLQIYLKTLTQIIFPLTLDPTLILGKKVWEDMCNPVKEKKYIAVYAVQNEEETIEYARQIARLLNKRIVIIRSYSKSYLSKENKEHASPTEFLSYIRNADFVVTTSFHGTVFSLIFQKQFVCPIFRENPRIESLLELVGLDERRVFINKDIRGLNDIDYTKVTNRIKIAINDTTSFLDSIFLQ